MMSPAIFPNICPKFQFHQIFFYLPNMATLFLYDSLWLEGKMPPYTKVLGSFILSPLGRVIWGASCQSVGSQSAFMLSFEDSVKIKWVLSLDTKPQRWGGPLCGAFTPCIQLPKSVSTGLLREGGENLPVKAPEVEPRAEQQKSRVEISNGCVSFRVQTDRIFSGRYDERLLLRLQNKTRIPGAFISPWINGLQLLFFNAIPKSVVLQWGFRDAPKAFRKLPFSLQAPGTATDCAAAWSVSRVL